MKTGLLRVLSLLIAIVMLGGAAACLAEASDTPADLREEAARNYASMSKAAYIDWVISQLTPEEKGKLTGNGDTHSGVAGEIWGVDRLNIRHALVGDGEEGVNTDLEATMLPAAVALAASWDPELAREYGAAMGKEAKKLGVSVLLTPRVNIVRDPASGGNGGNYQTFSEDPLLNGLLGAGEALGIQQEGVISNLKQMFGSSTGSAQGSTASVMNEQTMREVYLRAFDLVIKNAGVGASMTNYSTINNATKESGFGQSSTWDWNTLLRKQMGFEGFIEPDWGRLDGTETVKTGMDWEPMGGSTFGYDPFTAAVEAGTITWDEVDIAVRNILGTFYDYGLLDPSAEFVSPERFLEKNLIPEEMKLENALVARRVAEEGAVLLKNDGQALPLSAEDITGGKVAFIGYPAANLAQPSFKEAAAGFYDRKVSTLSALASELGVNEKDLVYYVGSDMTGTEVPAEMLKYVDEDGVEHQGLRFYASEGGGWGGGPVTITEGEPVEDLHFIGEKALPGKTEDGGLNAVNIHGKIYAGETGEYRINVVQRFPGDDEYEGKKTFFTGSLTVNGQGIGAGTRMIVNGAANGNSSVVTANMGDGYHNWNLCGGPVTLEGGQWYDIDFNVGSVYGEDIQFELTWITPSMRSANVEEAVAGAEKADTAVVFIWQDAASQSTDGGTLSSVTNLKEGQLELIQAVAAAYEKTIVVCNNGDAFNVGAFRDDVDAILEMWWPGQEGGFAMADLLLGKAAPNGKLPVSYPVSEERSVARNAEHQERYGSVGGSMDEQSSYSYFTEGIDNGYRTYIRSNNEDVLYPFGYGLSYTSFDWSDVRVSAREEGGYDVEVKVTNTGSYAGRDVVQVYLGAPEEQPEGIQFSALILGGFAKTGLLQPGESENVRIQVLESTLSYWDSGEVGSLTAEELREMLSLGGSDAETAKAAAAEWYAGHNPDYEGVWRVAEGNRRLYVMRNASWDSEVYSETIQVKAAADAVAAPQEQFRLPVMVEDAVELVKISGLVAYDEEALKLVSAEAAEGYRVTGDGAAFTFESEDGKGANGNVTVGYLTFEALDKTGTTLVTFPATKRDSFDSFGRITYKAVPDLTVRIQ